MRKKSFNKFNKHKNSNMKNKTNYTYLFISKKKVRQIIIKVKKNLSLFISFQ